MSIRDDQRKLIAANFDKLHSGLAGVRAVVDGLNDRTATDLVNAMEFGLLAPLRKLRLWLDIPYLDH